MTRTPRTQRRVAIFLLVVALAVGLVSMTSVGTGGAAPPLPRPLIVWLEQGAGNPYWDAEHRAAAEAGRRLGFRFKAVSGNLEASDQAAILRQLVDEREADLVMVNALDAKTIGPSLLYARAKRVPIVFLYGRDSRATASIGFDEIRSGQLAAKQALGLLRRHKVPRTIAVLGGIRGQPASDLRTKGFVDSIAKAGVKVIAVQPTNWQADRASAIMRSWLKKYPRLSMVYALSDTIAVPAMTAAARQNRLCTLPSAWKANPSCVAFVSVDGFFTDQVAKRRLFSTQLYSPYWTGYTYTTFAAEVMITSGRFNRNRVLNSLLVTTANAACIARMQNAMKDNIKSFRFSGTLQQIAVKHGCKVLDGNP